MASVRREMMPPSAITNPLRVQWVNVRLWTYALWNARFADGDKSMMVLEFADFARE
jgi:hypothetical protein